MHSLLVDIVVSKRLNDFPMLVNLKIHICIINLNSDMYTHFDCRGEHLGNVFAADNDCIYVYS